MVVMDDAFIPIIIGLAVGASGGAISAFLGWIKESQVFESKKFVYGIIVGIFTGLFAAQGFQAQLQSAQTASELTWVLIAILASTIAVDTFRTAITGAIRAKKTASTDNE